MGRHGAHRSVRASPAAAGGDEGKTGLPYEEVIEATLAADGDRTVLVIEERGMPLDVLADYGAGMQIHVEDLAAHMVGRERSDDPEARWARAAPDLQSIGCRRQLATTS